MGLYRAARIAAGCVFYPMGHPGMANGFNATLTRLRGTVLWLDTVIIAPGNRMPVIFNGLWYLSMVRSSEDLGRDGG